ncbi:serine--tRNA ligase [bacterium]|nr:serine--tRNA ligase [bacterium]
MHDIKYIRYNFEEFQQKLVRRGVVLDFDKSADLLKLDAERRELTGKLDSMLRTRNSVSREIGRLKKLSESASTDSEGLDISKMRSEMLELGEGLKEIEKELRDTDETIRTLLLSLPNLPSEKVPDGLNETNNELVKDWSKPPEFDFELRDHLDVGERLGMLDFRRGGKITGSGFPVWSGAGAQLERALLNLMLDLHTGEYGYREMMTPFLANRESMLGSGQIPKLEDDMYHIEKDDLFLLPTSEVTLINLHRDEILTEAELPIKYAAYSPCFRREAGAYGRTTRGFLRTHQFNKVELVRFDKPEDSYTALDEMLGHAEEVLRRLELHYRVVKLCAGELPFAGAFTYDIEVWAPADGGRWLEVSSVTNTEAFQARRANIRYRPKEGGKLQFIHTLNGSGLATSRLMVALLESYQTEEGSFAIPPVLRSYMNRMTVITSSTEEG